MDFLKTISEASITVMFLLMLHMTAQAEAPEYRVKAAMLFKFAIFVDWPARAFTSGASPFVVCVLGKDPFGQWLYQEVGETQVGPHPVEIRRLERGEDAGGCHMVFISRSEKPLLSQTLALFRNKIVLLVSDVDNTAEFCRQGGMISLFLDNGKVRFELNSKAISDAGLTIDSRLKRIARSAKCGEGP